MVRPLNMAWRNEIISQLYHGGQFEGPECRKILKDISSHQKFAKKHAIFEAIEIINCLRKFTV